MMRAVALAARLDFAIEPHSLDAIRANCHDIARSSALACWRSTTRSCGPAPPSGRFATWRDSACWSRFSEELHRGAAASLWQVVGRVDAYRRQFDAMPDALTNAILLAA